MVKKIDFQISRRQSGKTRSIVNMAVRDLACGRKPCIITATVNEARRLKQDYEFELKDVDVFSAKSKRISPGYVPDVIYLDEYLFFDKEVQKDFNVIIPMISEHVYIKTTAPFMVDKEIFELVRLLRKNSITSDIVKMVFSDPKQKEQFHYLMNNLLTHPKTELNVDYDFYKSVLGEYNFQTEHLGKFFK